MQIRIVASRMMKAGEVRKWAKRLKSDMDQLQLMLDLQIDIRSFINWCQENGVKGEQDLRNLIKLCAELQKESESNRMVA